MEKGLILSGARALFSMNGVEVGWATSVSIGESTQYEEAAVLNNIEVEEFVPTGYRVSFSARRFRIIGKSLRTLGWAAKVGTGPEKHLLNLLNQGDLTATIEDTKTGKIFATVSGVKVSDFSWTVDARGIIGEDVQFVAVRVADESETA